MKEQQDITLLLSAKKVVMYWNMDISIFTYITSPAIGIDFCKNPPVNSVLCQIDIVQQKSPNIVKQFSSN